MRETANRERQHIRPPRGAQPVEKKKYIYIYTHVSFRGKLQDASLVSQTGRKKAASQQPLLHICIQSHLRVPALWPSCLSTFLSVRSETLGRALWSFNRPAGGKPNAAFRTRSESQNQRARPVYTRTKKFCRRSNREEFRYHNRLRFQVKDKNLFGSPHKALQSSLHFEVSSHCSTYCLIQKI